MPILAFPGAAPSSPTKASTSIMPETSSSSTIPPPMTSITTSSCPTSTTPKSSPFTSSVPDSPKTDSSASSPPSLPSPSSSSPPNPPPVPPPPSPPPPLAAPPLPPYPPPPLLPHPPPLRYPHRPPRHPPLGPQPCQLPLQSPRPHGYSRSVRAELGMGVVGLGMVGPGEERSVDGAERVGAWRGLRGARAWSFGVGGAVGPAGVGETMAAVGLVEWGTSSFPPVLSALVVSPTLCTNSAHEPLLPYPPVTSAQP